ncbi:MAG: hypothetical protein ACYSTG_00435, partial [Planctomycetota bacterium]
MNFIFGFELDYSFCNCNGRIYMSPCSSAGKEEAAPAVHYSFSPAGTLADCLAIFNSTPTAAAD